MEKQSLILKLHKEGKITEDEAKILLQETERVVYVDRYVQPYINPYPIQPFTPPYYPQLPITVCGTNASMRIEESYILN